MNNLIKNLIENTKSDNSQISMDALTDLGLLIERHTQKRYLEKDYLNLLGNNLDLYEYKLKDEEVELIIHFMFYHIINIQKHPVTVAWCLGKCYGYDIRNGIEQLMIFYAKNEEVHQQLTFSKNALFG